LYFCSGASIPPKVQDANFPLLHPQNWRSGGFSPENFWTPSRTTYSEIFYLILQGLRLLVTARTCKFKREHGFKNCIFCLGEFGAKLWKIVWHLGKSLSLVVLNLPVTVNFVPKSEHGRLAANCIHLESCCYSRYNIEGLAQLL